MSVLNGLEPEAVFRIFEEIAGIPRPSYKEKAISDYLVDFAEDHGLEHHRDELNNVIIIKPATAGYEEEPPIILQGHMDMVCEQEADCTKDMEKEGLDLILEGDVLSARGTTLGGDDGVAIAIALAILSDDGLSHPRLEFVCTVSEEVGMDGAHGLDTSILQGRRMINIDSESEGEILAGCAGGGTVHASLSLSRSKHDGSGDT
ncbi:MAG: M20/M25/M40 family metallo-hydrolase, partial [Lachnospiraceae bacterium]|nr:M20/M25/M40 family metallo-hydrolase [Lachnospiraceae bacterium]